MIQLQEPACAAGFDEPPIGNAPPFELTKQHDHQVIPATRLCNAKESAQAAREFAIPGVAPRGRHHKDVTGRWAGPTADLAVFIGETNDQVSVGPWRPNLPMLDILIQQALQFDRQRTDPGGQVGPSSTAEHCLYSGTQPVGTSALGIRPQDRKHGRTIHALDCRKEIWPDRKTHRSRR